MQDKEGWAAERSRSETNVPILYVLLCVKQSLAKMQQRMGRTLPKLLKEVETRWNITNVGEPAFRERSCKCSYGCFLPSEVTMLTPMEFTIIKDCLGVLGPFNQVTIELSEKKRVSASKILTH